MHTGPLTTAVKPRAEFCFAPLLAPGNSWRKAHHIYMLFVFPRCVRLVQLYFTNKSPYQHVFPRTRTRPTIYLHVPIKACGEARVDMHHPKTAFARRHEATAAALTSSAAYAPRPTLLPCCPPSRLPNATHAARAQQVEQTKKAAENPEQAAKIMRGAGEKVKAEADSVMSSFERFRAALKEEVAGGAGSAAGGSSGRSTAPSSSRAPPKSGPTSTRGGGGINSDIAARVQRRRR